jgi:hypothetical protein
MASNGTALVVQETLPPIANYERARSALVECDSFDEVKEIADTAVALQVYAKQSKDTELEDIAKRIRLRATRRMGELLQSVKVSPGGRPPKTPSTAPVVSRKSIAEDAGIGEQQRKDAERVASVPKEEFERIVEAPNPPTPRQLGDQVARQPRKAKPPLGSPDDHVLQLVKFARWINHLDVDALADGYNRATLDDVLWACNDIHDGLRRIMHVV